MLYVDKPEATTRTFDLALAENGANVWLPLPATMSFSNECGTAL